MNDMKAWLESIGLAQYADVFHHNDITPDVLDELNERDLAELGVSLGHRKRLLKAIAARRGTGSQANLELAPDYATPTGERRQLTIMFCDLVGSTQLSVLYDPEDYREIIKRYLDCCEDVIRRFRGYVARYMGDGILVFFGYPQADEHDPERAVRSGLEIIDAVARLDVGPKLQVRVGISTGDVVVGDLVGEGAAQEISAAGRTPNLAARLQALAEPGSVVISESTRKLAGGLFEYADLGSRELKGFDHPVTVYRVIAERSVDSRFEAIRGNRTSTRLLGREHEAESLWRCWRLASEGHGQTVLISGEAGVGKSRLTQALRDRLSREQYQLLRYYGVPYYRDTPLYPVVKSLERGAGFGRDDTSDQKLEKLSVLLGRSSADRADDLQLIAAFMGIPFGERHPPLNLSPERQMDRTLEALEGQLLDLLDDQPVLMVFEDLQWVDSTSLELLQRVAAGLQDLPLMLVMTHRPEFQPQFDPRPNLTRLVLDGLDREQSEALVLDTAGGKPLPREVVDHIVSKTDGVPLFVEELTKSVLESSLLEEKPDHYALSGPLPARALPDTLQDSLMARLDRLGATKQLVQQGSVIGRQFSYALLRAVSRLEDDALNRGLEQMLKAELVSSRGSSPDTVYTFKHALVQDAAYSSLLRGQRRALHARIADSLVEGFPGTVASEPELLARHYTEAGRSADAIPYWQAAGKHAGDRAAYKEAIEHLNAGLGLLDDVPQEVRSGLELGLRVLLGHNLTCTLGYAVPAVADTFNRAYELCQSLGDAPELFPVLQGLYRYYLVRAQLDTAQDIARQCVAFGEQTQDTVHLVSGYEFLGYVFYYKGEFWAAARELTRSLDLYEAHRGEGLSYLSPEDPGVSAYSIFGIVNVLLGNITEARRCVQSAIDLARELENPFGSAYAHGYAAHLCDFLEEWDEMARHASEVIDISRKYGFDLWLKVGEANLAIAQGTFNEPHKGIPALEANREQWRSAGIEINSPPTVLRLAVCHLMGGDSDSAMSVVEEELEHVEQLGLRFLSASLHQVRGLINQSCGELVTAEQDLKRSLRIADDQGSLLLGIRSALSLYDLLVTQNRAGDAKQVLSRLLSLFPEGTEIKEVRRARELVATA
ncbi:MAG: adenylate/guanylate cyclase domain-containing protein [Gemmatimonadales bacterium]